VRKAALILPLFAVAAVSVSLAAQPKPMDCDSWECKGKSCSPAKYVSVRNEPILAAFAASPVYKAAALEGGLAGLALLFAGVFSGKRRRAAAKEAPAPNALETP